MCPRLQKCFWILLLIWAIYLLGVIATAVQIHKLDPTTATENTSLETKKEVSVHAAIQNTRQISPEELMKQKQEELEREKERTIHKEGEVNSKELAKTLRKETADKKDEVEKDKKKDKDTGRKAKEEKKPEEAERPKPKMKRPGWRPSPYGHMVDPVALLKEQTKDADDSSNKRMVPSSDQMLTAYLETIDQSTWDELPLPVRTTTADNLTKRVYPKLSTCSKLPEQWPVDEYPDEDPFLPWIHDVFPTDDGKFIQFVAQNKQRCHTGTTDSEEALLKHTAPQVALMQHVPLKKLDNGRYRLASHEDADPESINTRFLCKFKPSGDITFSRYNNDYEWVAYRKGLRVMFNKDGRNNGQIQTSQVLFQCPVPDHLVETVRRGSSVVDDWATIFVDLIPVRTPPRYGNPQQFLVPEYRKAVEDRITKDDLFDPNEAWGTDHILPELEDSGRWVNIPVCKPSLMTYEPEVLEPKEQAEGEIDSNDGHGINHHLVSCLWASTGYTTRGNRYAINDGQRRMLEWITFNKMLGFDHFYIYDNSGAFTNETSLQPFVDTFPGEVTVIKWPSRVCNNNPNNVDSPGERSSQYAAEASCRLRFGQHATWIGQFDIDEYLVPMGNYTSLLQLLDKLDEEGNKIISFASWRAWPRHTHIE